jgi:hypothetical protein
MGMREVVRVRLEVGSEGITVIVWAHGRTRSRILEG